TGKTLSTVGEPGTYTQVSLAPDERHVAVSLETAGANADVWVIDTARAAITTRLTFEPTSELFPIWSPDGSRVAFTTGTAQRSIGIKSASGGGTIETAFTSPAGSAWPTDWSRDGRYIA